MLRVRGAHRAGILGALLSVAVLGFSQTAAAAGSTTVGVGALQGNVTFQTPIPLAPAFGPDAWTFSGNVIEDITIEAVPVGYIGPVTVTANGSSAGAMFAGESGTVTVSAQGTSTSGGYINCTQQQNGVTIPGLSGGYLRDGTHVIVTVQGVCDVSHYPVNVEFVVQGEFYPTSSGNQPVPPNGVTSQITQAAFVGTVTINTLATN